MRNRALHDALREFALETAALLTDDMREGAELEYDVVDHSSGRGPALYRYRPLTDRFIADRWPRLRELATCTAAAEALGSGAAPYLRMNGLRGEQAEPALQAMLDRLYDDATNFKFPEERFERVYAEVERTLYRDAVPATVVAALPGLMLESDRVELGDGLALVRSQTTDAPPEAVWPQDGDGAPAVLCVLDRSVAPDDPSPVDEARARFRELVTDLRLYKPGGVSLSPLGWRRASEGRWTPFELEGAGAATGEPWELPVRDEKGLCDFLDAIGDANPSPTVAWSLARFDMGCGREVEAQVLSDHLLALRALLDATGDAGRASLGLRLAALCAEEGERRAAQRRVEQALALESYVMRGGKDGDIAGAVGAESPRALVAEMERHLRALLRDVLCGYLDSELKGVADDILLESSEPFAIEARDLRTERQTPTDPVTDELEAVSAAAPRPRRMAGFRPQEQQELVTEPEPEPEAAEEFEAAAPEGVTPSADWLDEDPDSYGAPV